MLQFLNNIWIAMSSENLALVTYLTLPLFPVENFVLMSLFLSVLNVNTNNKKKSIYVCAMTAVSIFNLYFTTSPFNILLNYSIMFILMKFIFNLTILKSFIALITPTFIFALLNILLQKPYFAFCNITLELYNSIAIYKIPYLLLVYFLCWIICIFFYKFNRAKIDLNVLDNLDKKTSSLLLLNLLLGLLTLCLQLVTTGFYINIVPIIITILNFVLLASFLILSIYSFTRVIKLSITRKDLQSAEEYNKSLEILYDEVKGFKHDFDNIISTLDGFIENDDMIGLKSYFSEIKKDCKTTNNLAILNPRAINNPGIYSLLNNKYFKATNLGITFDIEYFLDLDKININLYQFSRMLGVLIDNAIEEAEKCEEKLVKITFIKEHKNNRAVISIENTYSNKNVDIEKIFNKGESGKQDHSGIGLWEVRNYVKKSKNLDLFTSKTDKLFKQELSIYDLQKK